MKLLIPILTFTLITACATQKKSMLLGAGIGAGVGTGVASHRKGATSQQRATGAVIGALLGGLIGYHSKKSKKESDTLSDAKAPTLEEKAPFLTRPKVRMYWVPDKITGDKYIEGHRTWVIEKSSTWSK